MHKGPENWLQVAWHTPGAMSGINPAITVPDPVHPTGGAACDLQMRQRIEAIAATGRTQPVPAPSDRKRAAAEKAAAIEAARAAQQVEDTALRELDGVKVCTA